MNRYHLDTTTFSLLMREHGPALARIERLPDVRLAIAAVVRGEIRHGLARLPAGRRRERLASRAEALFAALACDEIAEPAADRYGAIKRALERRGTGMSDNDLWIAAAALAADATLVTADGDFARVPGLRVEDWSR